jgi:tetratricopeptide (TPR) repeat protein
MASIYYRLGEYQKSRMEVSKWLERYPQSPLKGEALFLLGRNYKALGDNPRAFYWWTGAIREFQDSPDRQGEINDRIVGLIKYSPIEDLNEMAKYATGETERGQRSGNGSGSIYARTNLGYRWAAIT